MAMKSQEFYSTTVNHHTQTVEAYDPQEAATIAAESWGRDNPDSLRTGEKLTVEVVGPFPKTHRHVVKVMVTLLQYFEVLETK